MPLERFIWTKWYRLGRSWPKDVLVAPSNIFVPSSCSNNKLRNSDRQRVKCKREHSRQIMANSRWSRALAEALDGENACRVQEPQSTDDRNHPPKMYQFVSPEISVQNETALNALVFDTTGGCEVTIEGKHFGEEPSQLCVTVGRCSQAIVEKMR